MTENAILTNPVMAMRKGGFTGFPKGRVSDPLRYLSVPPPVDDAPLVSAWISGSPWLTTGYSVRYPAGKGISDSEMMDLEISLANSSESVRKTLEFPAAPGDPEAKEAFSRISSLLMEDSGFEAPPLDELVKGFSASLAAVISEHAPEHGKAISEGSGEFVAGEKLGPGLKAFALFLARTHALNGEEPKLTEQPDKGASFISPRHAINLQAMMDRAAFRSLILGETVPQALAVTIFEVRHALDERLSASILPAQESWDAFMQDPRAYFLSPDRTLIPALAEQRAPKKMREPVIPASTRQQPPAQKADDAAYDPWSTNVQDYDDNDPASFGL